MSLINKLTQIQSKLNSRPKAKKIECSGGLVLRTDVKAGALNFCPANKSPFSTLFGGSNDMIMAGGDDMVQSFAV